MGGGGAGGGAARAPRGGLARRGRPHPAAPAAAARRWRLPGGSGALPCEAGGEADGAFG